MESNLKTVLIGGGSGFLGTTLRNSLKKQGYNVVIVSRKAGPSTMSWADLESNGLPTNTKAVISMAGQNIFDIKKKWTPEFKQLALSSRVDTTKSLANAIKTANEKPDVFISLSGIGYYRASLTKEFTEESPGGDSDFLSELAAAWEKATTLPPECQNVRRVIIRTGVVMGRHGGVMKSMYWPFYFGFGGPVASGQQCFNWIHISDMIGLISYSIENSKVDGILNAVAPQLITNQEFAQSLGKAMWRPAIFPTPAFLLNLAFGQERANILAEGRKVIPKRVLELGYTFKFTDINAACQECVSSTAE